MMKIKGEKVLIKAIKILSHELMMITNDTAENWESGAIKQAIWELADEEESHCTK